MKTVNDMKTNEELLRRAPEVLCGKQGLDGLRFSWTCTRGLENCLNCWILASESCLLQKDVLCSVVISASKCKKESIQSAPSACLVSMGGYCGFGPALRHLNPTFLRKRRDFPKVELGRLKFSYFQCSQVVRAYNMLAQDGGKRSLRCQAYILFDGYNLTDAVAFA